VDILDRGDLDDWKPIAAAIVRDPPGPFATRVMHLVDAFPMYGTSRLWRTWIARCRDRAEEGPAREPPATLRELRQRRGLTQVDLAERIGMSQSDLSKLERRRDLKLSTLRAYIEGLGGRLELRFLATGGSRAVRVPPDSREGRGRSQGSRK
jgi:DNA-binding XRE family transcriptional regulator